MPLFDPMETQTAETDLTQILEAAGLGPKSDLDALPLPELLKKLRLGPKEVLTKARDLIDCSESENTKVQLLKMIAEMNKMIKPDGAAQQQASFTVVIKNSSAPQSESVVAVGINPIILPREAQKLL